VEKGNANGYCIGRERQLKEVVGERRKDC